MLRQVWKYDVESGSVSMPLGAEILSVQMQRGVITLWALVDPTAPVVTRSFVVVGTGHDLPDGNLMYRGTVQAGTFVWHVFERLTVAAA